MSGQKAKLTIVAGPDVGLEMEIAGDELIVGRGSQVGLTLGDRLLSRQHARVFKAMDGWYVEDLRSTNGTWMQGKPVTMPEQLRSGERFRVGKTVLELTLPAYQSEAFMEQTNISFWLDPGSMESLTIVHEGGESKMRREQEKLAAIYEVQGLLRKNVDSGELYQTILEIITRVVPSDIAYLLLVSEQDGHLVPVGQLTHVPDAVDHVSAYLSGSVINHVRSNHKAVLSSDESEANNLNQTYVSGMKMSSIMCAPLLGSDELLGMIYVMSMQGSHVFEQDDLRLLTAIAQSAAMAIENNRLMARNLQSERMAAIGMTAAGLAHYVKNILAGLEGSISLLRLGIDGENRRTMDAAWQILNSNNRRLSALMLDMLSLSKETRLYFETYNVVDVIREVTDLVAGQAGEDKIALTLDDETASLTLLAEIDGQGIHRVLLNLCNNAVDSVRQKHGESGDGWVRVFAHIDENDALLRLCVMDNGCGVPAQDREQIFESFHTTKGERGTGLGLAVCRRIVEGHGGDIWVDCEKETTLFWVELPVKQKVSETTSVQREGMMSGNNARPR